MHHTSLAGMFILTLALASAESDCPEGFLRISNPWNRVHEEFLHDLSTCYAEAGRVGNFEDCAAMCMGMGGAQACVHNYAELDALLYTFNREDVGDILVQNTNGGACFETKNWWVNDPNQGGAHLREQNCLFDDGNHRCICQNVSESCELGQDWEISHDSGSLLLHDRYHSSSDESQYHGHGHDHGHDHNHFDYDQGSGTLRLVWAPEFFSFLLFACFTGGHIAHYIFSAVFSNPTKPFPLSALAAGFVTLSSCGLAAVSVTSAHHGTRIDGISMAASILGGFITMAAAAWDYCTCCAPFCCSQAYRAVTLSRLYALGGHLSVLNSFAMVVDAGSNACGDSDKLCTILVFQVIFCLFFALQAVFLFYLSRLHAPPSKPHDHPPAQHAITSPPAAADTIVYHGGAPGVHTLVGAGATATPSAVLVREAWAEPQSPPPKPAKPSTTAP